MPTLKIDLPLHVDLPRKTKADKRFYLNINTYRNTHHFILNDAKRIYGEIVREALGPIDALTPPISCQYTLFPKTMRRMDLGNTLSIVQKFLEDAIVSAGVVSDDSYKVINRVVYKFGEVDKDNPRVELVIHGSER